MGLIGQVLSFARRVVEGVPRADVKGDPGGGANHTVQHFAPPGDDSQPLPGDTYATTSVRGSGHDVAVAYADPKNAGEAAAGEVRRYARAADGTPVCEFWLKSDGAVEITSIASGSVVTINGVTIDQDGNISTPGDVTANEGASSVTLGTHTHPTAMGPSGSPTPGS